MIEWAVQRFDNSALRVFVSWLERIRNAGVVSVLHVDRARHGNVGRFER